MQYTLAPPDGGADVTDFEEIRSLYADSCRAAAAQRDFGGGDEGEGAGSVGAVPEIELVWRLANQSLLADLMQQLQVGSIYI